MSNSVERERDRLLQALEFSRLGVWEWDASTDIITLSQRAAEIFGVAHGSITAAELSKNIVEPDRHRARSAIEEAVAERADYAVVYRVRRPSDGAIVWIEAKGRASFSGDRLEGMTGLIEDITHRKKQEETLAEERRSLERADLEREVEERTEELRTAHAKLKAEVAERETAEGRFRLLVASVQDYAIYMLDPNGVVTNWNAGAERIKGYRADEVVGHHFSRFYTEEDRTNNVPGRGLDTAAKTGKFATEGWRVRKDGSHFWASVVINAIYDRNSKLVGFAKITRDVTERREAEIALQRAQEQLAQSQKMEGIGQLTGGVAHDFNNLLTIIMGNIEAIQRALSAETLDKGRVTRLAGNAMQGADRAAALTQRLLAFSRRQPLDPKPVDAGRLIVGMSDLLRRALGEQVALETVITGGLWRVNADPNQLEISLLNLAVNARDAMPKGGKLTIETANAHLDERYAAAQAEVRPGDYVVICVSDTGTGMAKDVLEHAFEPFFTTKDVGHGTGLGLSQVYGFVKQSGGHVKIYTESNEGTTVKIYLPRLNTDVVNAQEATGTPLVDARGSETILLVEDEDDVRAHSREILAELGYNVVEASHGRGALKLLDAHPEIDLLFTDVGLPYGMNGRQLADEAVRRRPNLKVLFTSGYARNAIVHEGRLDPGVYLITKPFSYGGLAEKLRSILD